MDHTGTDGTGTVCTRTCDGPYESIPPTGEHGEVSGVMVAHATEDGISYPRGD